MGYRTLSCPAFFPAPPQSPPFDLGVIFLSHDTRYVLAQRHSEQIRDVHPPNVGHFFKLCSMDHEAHAVT